MATLTEWSAIAAIAAAFAALISATGLVISISHQRAESRRYRLSQSIDLLLKLEDRFDSNSFRIQRSIAARGALNGNIAALDPVLDYFETIGLLLDRSALDEEMIWSSFSDWLLKYWQIAAEYIALAQQEDPTLWSYLEKLLDRINNVEERVTHRRYPPLAQDQKTDFLKSEACLCTDQSAGTQLNLY